jgi:hypothetical protein
LWQFLFSDKTAGSIVECVVDYAGISGKYYSHMTTQCCERDANLRRKRCGKYLTEPLFSRKRVSIGERGLLIKLCVQYLLEEFGFCG